MTTGDVKEDSDRQEADHEARAAVGDEWERNPGQRGEPDDGGEVDRSLPRDEGRDAGGEPFAERILAGDREAKPRVGERAVGDDDERESDQAELLADHREDH